MPKKVPSKTKDLPATHEMLHEVRNELKQVMEAGFKRVSADVVQVKSETHEIKSLFHQAMLRFEEQRAENKVVLEALQGLAQRQDRLESDFVEVRNVTRALAKAKSSKGTA